MKSPYLAFVASVVVVTVASAARPARAADAATPADKAFVGKVSQGGMYEVEASKLAAERAAAQDVRDQAATEVHDHQGVNQRLKKIADAAGVALSDHLNAEFQKRLDALRATPADKFDAAYLEDMKQIHDKDEKLFAKEAEDGTGEFKAFAAETDRIVKRHIGALHGAD